MLLLHYLGEYKFVAYTFQHACTVIAGRCTLWSKKPALTSWLSIVKYSVRYFTITYVQLIWYSKSQFVFEMSTQSFDRRKHGDEFATDWLQYRWCADRVRSMQRRYVSVVHSCRWRGVCKPFQRPPFLMEFGNRPLCAIVFILPEKFNNNFIIVRERHYQLRT